ncbi:MULTISPECIES: GspH/FimT family pseudopilin [Vibrio]|uniref:Type II secretion system protein H n=2 Tax=Vibrio TaxID=662 RepID=A0A0A5HUI6_PHOS4|nr:MULTISPECIES: GspH/FimT family pseudopilin [Vibrio]KGY09222.1 pilus assembly protein FimT [Vibrio sinaloensis]KHD23979.1 pilus assembly protein FimT [Vibrio caribbeanicus]KHT46072.1 pilus assembly protein FimT [Vibrio sinaloensis]KHT49571.1 pilus assembly protein FimT [Vibrio sinaloensis]
MSRGFTLLELLVSIAVLGTLMVWALPNYSDMTDTVKMRRLAKELNGFVLMAKSEAVLRRERLWVHLIMSGASDSNGDWRLELTNSDVNGAGDVYSALSGVPFEGVTLSTTYTSNQISFDETHGRPKAGRFTFHPKSSPSSALDLRTYHRSAIVRVCSPSANTYLSYEKC